MQTPTFHWCGRDTSSLTHLLLMYPDTWCHDNTLAAPKATRLRLKIVTHHYSMHHPACQKQHKSLAGCEQENQSVYFYVFYFHLTASIRLSIEFMTFFASSAGWILKWHTVRFQNQDFSLCEWHWLCDRYTIYGNETTSKPIHIQIQNMSDEVKCFKLSLSRFIYKLTLTCFLFPWLNTDTTVLHHVAFGCHFKYSVIQLNCVFSCKRGRLLGQMISCLVSNLKYFSM